MRRVFMLSFVTVVLLSSASFSAAKDFSRFSCNIPEGWTSSEQSQGSAVTFDKDGTTNIVVELSKGATRTLEESARSICTDRNGTDFVSNSDGSYSFVYYISTLRFIATLYDNQTDPGFPEGVRCLFSKLDTCDEESAAIIRDSIVINSEWANDTGEVTGTVQDFTKLSVEVPDGWTASEDSSGNVYIRKDDANARIGLQMLKMGSTTLQNLTLQAFNAFNGTGEVKSGRYGMYFYTASGNIIFVSDNNIGGQTHPGIPDGICLILHLEGGLYHNETDLVFGSIVVNEDWANGTGTDTHTTLDGTVQKFTRISVKIPDGWTGSESESGQTVYVRNNETSSMVFSIQAFSKSNLTLEEIANRNFTDLDGIGEVERSSSGLYMFNTSNGGLVFLLDKEYNSQITDGYFCLMYVPPMTVAIEVIYTLLDSIAINEDWVYNRGLDNDSTDGTVQTLTVVSVKVPDGWTASENNTGEIVYITKTVTPMSEITLQLIEMGNRTLREIAEECYNNINGRGEIQEQNGVYMFATEESGGAAFVFDHEHSKLVEGFCCLMYVSGQNPGADLTTVQNSLTINESWLNSRGQDGQDIPSNPESGDIPSDPESGDIPSDPESEDIPSNTESLDTPIDLTSSGGGGGGCSSGLPVLSLALCGLVFFRKR